MEQVKLSELVSFLVEALPKSATSSMVNRFTKQRSINCDASFVSSSALVPNGSRSTFASDCLLLVEKTKLE